MDILLELFFNSLNRVINSKTDLFFIILFIEVKFNTKFSKFNHDFGFEQNYFLVKYNLTQNFEDLGSICKMSFSKPSDNGILQIFTFLIESYVAS